MRWTHFTLPVTDLDATVQFFTEDCQLSVVRDRRREGGSTLWLGPRPAPGCDPEFVLVAFNARSRSRWITSGFNVKRARR